MYKELIESSSIDKRSRLRKKWLVCVLYWEILINGRSFHITMDSFKLSAGMEVSFMSKDTDIIKIKRVALVIVYVLINLGGWFSYRNIILMFFHSISERTDMSFERQKK